MRPKLTPEQMVSPRAFAPFEVAEVFAEWGRQSRAHLEAFQAEHGHYPTGSEVEALEWCNGLGPSLPIVGETNREFGERAALALFTLIKEI